MASFAMVHTRVLFAKNEEEMEDCYSAPVMTMSTLKSWRSPVSAAAVSVRIAVTSSSTAKTVPCWFHVTSK